MVSSDYFSDACHFLVVLYTEISFTGLVVFYLVCCGLSIVIKNWIRVATLSASLILRVE
jgi:hypothetical protein